VSDNYLFQWKDSYQFSLTTKATTKWNKTVAGEHDCWSCGMSRRKESESEEAVVDYDCGGKNCDWGGHCQRDRRQMEPLPGVLSIDREKVAAVKNDIRWRNNLTSFRKSSPR